MASFLFIFAACVLSLLFGLLCLHFLSCWPLVTSFPLILTFWAFTFFYLVFFLCLHFLSFCIVSVSLIFSFWLFCRFTSFCSGVLSLHVLLFWPFVASCAFMSAFCGFISFHFGVVCFHFFHFWLFVALFPFILSFCAFICFHFGFLSLQVLSFWLLCGLFLFIFVFLRLHFFSFWRFVASCPFILAFVASFSLMLTFRAFISFHFGLSCLHFLPLSCFCPSPCQKLKNKHRIFGGFGLLAMPKLIKKHRVFLLFDWSVFQKV